jgi:hypothetical protein
MSASNKRFFLIGIIAALLAVVPVAMTRYLPLLDAAGHESRILALKDILVSGTGSPFYGLDTLLLPNVGFDLPGLVMAAWMSPQLVGRLFFAASIILTFAGVAVLGRVVLGRWRFVALASGLLLYNLFTLMGFLSYQMGIALLFWALAGRILLERAAAPVRLSLGALFGIVLLLCHVSAFAIYAVMLAGLALDLLVRRQRSLLQVVAIGVETVPALFLFTRMSTGGEGHMRYDLPFWHAKIFDAVKTVSSGSEAGDVAFVVGALAVAVLLLGCGRTRLARPFIPGLVVLGVLFFAVPPHVSGGSYVDSRIPVVIALLALASIDFRVRRPRLALAMLVVAGGAYLAKQVAIAALWYNEGRSLSRLAADFSKLPEGAVLLQAECSPNSADIGAVYASRQPPLTHVAAMAAFTDRRFVAATWTLKGQQSVYTRPAWLQWQSFQDHIGLEVCTAPQYHAALQGVRGVVASETGAGRAVPPVYLLLLRPKTEGALRDAAPLVAETPELEIYAVN